ncbi:MAG: DUF2452 domain-containing protein [Bacteroidia bacterium]
MSGTESNTEFVNPIDPKQVAENPGLLPYAHNVGSAIIRPLDKGRTKGVAMTAMYEQSERQLDQIRKQVDLLVQQARAIQQRVEISEQIYLADMNFKPIVAHIYHLYTKKDETLVLSMVAPDEWGKNPPYLWKATVKMMGDYTWDVLDSAE